MGGLVFLCAGLAAGVVLVRANRRDGDRALTRSMLTALVLASYAGTVGVLLECKGANANDEVLRDVSAHIAALNPPYTTAADVPADVMAREKELVMADITADPKNAGKPANILEKISEGKLRTRLAEIVLAEQPMANVGKYPNTTVGAALKKAGLEPVKFVRFKVGAVAL